MTPDHTPYLVDGDLRTPQDVLEWLIYHPETSAAQASIDLAERLDRERRQACRRGQSKWTRAMLLSKRSELEYLAKIYRDFPGGPPTGKTLRDHMRRIREGRWGRYLRDALAFRAAARAK